MRRLRAWLAALGAAGIGCAAPADPPAPQPVPFNHRVHAGDNRIGCTMCHAYAEHAPVAGIPSMARCRGCHRFVSKEKPDVMAVLKAFDDKKPLAWSRIDRLPDHVYFTHERHVAAGLRCQECHGEVETMEGAPPAPPLTMGWCVDCHRAKEAATDCLACHK
jgi:cytochrome c7-like protein/class III cytochrome C family protein